ISLLRAGESGSDSEQFHQRRDMRVVEDFGDGALWEVLRIASWKTIEAGTSIVKEGERADSFYLLVDGEARVTLQSNALNTLKPGDCFGDLLYFTGRTEPRTTTVAAVGQISAIEINAQALRTATDAVQAAFNKASVRVLVHRLDQTNLRLAKR